MELKTNRIDLDTYFMLMAKVASLRSTCRHREQGVVLVKDNRMIATGYNGSAPGQPHCIDLEYCAKEIGRTCRAIGLHGESNAIASAAKQGVPTVGTIAYCLYSPCAACCNLLKSAGIAEVKYLEIYDGYPDGITHLSLLGVSVCKIEAKNILTWRYQTNQA